MMKKLCNAVLRAAVLATFAFALLAQAASAAPGVPEQVVGQEWRLVSYQGADGQTTDTSALGITIEVAADGTASGFGGCNRYRGTFQVAADGTITPGPIASTKVACLDANKTQWETRYFAALQTVSAYKLTGDRVQLVFANGAGLLTFAPVQAAPGGTLPGMPTTGAGAPPLWPAALGALLVALGGVALRRSARSAR